MKTLYPDGRYLVKFNIFGKEKTTMLNIINHGVIDGDLFYYENREGKQVNTISEFTSQYAIDLVREDDIDVKDSLHYWYKKNNHHYDKPLIKKDDLINGEEYLGNGWAYGLMLSYDDENVYYKLMLN